MKRLSLPVLMCLLLATASRAQQDPHSAADIMKLASLQAAKENKNIIVIFHASWCGWCHKMDSSINDKSCKKFFDDNYVITHMVVDESADKKNQETPGAAAFRTKYHGDQQGLPYWLVFDKNGNLLADSQMRPVGAAPDAKGESVGCPAAENEVSYFINILKRTSHISEAEEMAVRKRFRQNEN